MALGLALGLGIPFSLILGAVLGFYISQKYFKKQMKKNPPITKDQIRAMYSQMGRKPSEDQINQVLGAMKKQQK